jgi:hypothetical protein
MGKFGVDIHSGAAKQGVHIYRMETVAILPCFNIIILMFGAIY